MKKLDAHLWDREPEEHYCEPLWVDKGFFAAVAMHGTIHDPCCGFGRIPYAARMAGHKGVTGSDIVDRGQFAGVGIQNFLELDASDPLADNIVMNPPFNFGEEFIRQACRLVNQDYGIVAAIYPTRRLNAAHWMADLGLSEVYYLTPRPSMPPGHVAVATLEKTGKDPTGGKQDFCWVVFDRANGPLNGHRKVRWLHRDRGVI